MRFLIRPFDSSTQCQIRTIDHDFFSHPWTAKDWDDFFESKSCNYFMLGLAEEQEILGFILFQTIPGDELAHLLKIIVHPRHKGKGYGRKLLCEGHLRLGSLGIMASYLEVESSNKSAISLYCSEGYEVVHSKKNYYSNGSDGVMMRRG